MESVEHFAGWIQNCIAATLLFVIAVTSKRAFGSWGAPSAFFSGYWSIAILTAIMIAPDYTLWPWASWLILVFAFLFFCGALAGQHLSQRVNRVPFVIRKIYLVKPFIWLSFSFGILAVAVLLEDRGYALSDLLNGEAIKTISVDYSRARYHDDYNPSIVVVLLSSVNFAGAMLGGFWLAASKPKHVWYWLALLMIPLILQAVVLTSRNQILYPALFIFSTFFATLVMQRREFVFFRQLKISRVALVVLIAGSSYTGLQILRQGDVGRIDQDTLVLSVKKFRSAVFGSLPVYSQWLENNWDHNDPSYGAFSIAGVFDKLGVRERESGLYGEGVYLGDKGDQAEQSNIHTYFRGFIEDFTIVGSLLSAILAGLIMGYSYGTLRDGRVPMIVVVGFFYSYTIFGLIVSIANFNSILLAWIIFYFLLKTCVSSSPLSGRELRQAS
jgi:oligosaccharide repeat unit polymerase